MPKVEDLCARWRNVESGLTNIRNLWQQCADYAMPRKSNVIESKLVGSDDWTEDIFDDEAIHGIQVLASGQLDALFSGKWFESTPPWLDAPQGVKDWYARAGEIVLDMANKSNFPLEIHEFLLDRSCFATSHLHCDPHEEMTFIFTNDDVGGYAFEEDHHGMVSAYWGCRKFTTQQAVAKWGQEKMPKSVLESLAKPQGQGLSDEHEFIHYIAPRDSAERVYGKMDSKNMPWASLVFHVKDKHLVHEGGYPEQPFVGSRFLKWGRSPYGYGPIMLALPIIRQINGLEKLMDALAELQAFPRMLIPSGLEGVVGFGPSGVTIVDPNNPNGWPKEWATNGRYDIGKDRAEDIRRRIRRALHVDLFQMLTNMEEQKREKTATEVRAMLAERIAHFSPTFERLRVEVLGPLLKRMFSIAIRAGKLPPITREMANFVVSKGGTLEFPEFAYTSKLALAIKASDNLNWSEFVATVGVLFEVAPESVLEEINPNRTIRMLGRNLGLPIEIYNTSEEKAAIIEARQERQQAEMALAAAESASTTAKNVGQAAPALRN